MYGAHEFLGALTIVLGVAAFTTVLFQRLRQPVVLGYMLAGVLVGPHLPLPLVADTRVVQTLSELGVVLLMFALGLEFSVRKLARVGPAAGVTALFETSIMVWLGFIVARGFGWTVIESVFAGAIVSIASTTIVAKAFDDLRVRGPLRDLVVGVLLVEDLIAVLIMALLTAIATGTRVSAGTVGATVGRLAAFLALLVGVGLLVVPRLVRWVRRLDRPETLLVTSLALCFAVAVLALAAGYSVALGAFIAGTLVAESGEAHAITRLVRPIRDLFAAIFFVSVGMLIDPALIREHAGAVLAFTVLVILGKTAAVSFGAFLGGAGTRASVQAGMSLGQIGELSFILAGLGISLGATRDFLYPLAAAVSAITTLATPKLISSSARAAAFVDRKLPGPLQTAAALYATWLERLRSPEARDTVRARAKRLVRALVVDAGVLTGLVIGTSLFMERGSVAVAGWLRIGADGARAAIAVAGTVVSLPFCIGLVRNGRRLGLALASAALPEGAAGKPDLAAAPRRALLALLQLGTTVLVLLPVLAVTQPFVPRIPTAAVLGSLVLVLGVSFWRSAADLQGHVRAGAQVIVEALARSASASREPAPVDALSGFRAMFPGLGEPIAVRIPSRSAACGRTLSQLGVRGATGATVLAIARAREPVMVPTAEDVIRSDDVLALAGTHEAVEAARKLLEAEPASIELVG